MNNIKYIPADKLAKLNAKAKRHGKNYIAPDAPVCDGYNVPVFFAQPGIDSAFWVRCLIPADPDCNSHAFLDVATGDFEKLPDMIVGPVEWVEIQEAKAAADTLDQINAKAEQAKAKLAVLKDAAQ